MRLNEARVVLTGASGGIGLAITNALLASGAQVLAVSRHEDALRPSMTRYPSQLRWVSADLTSATDRHKVQNAAQAMGGINLLINAAGVNQFAMLEQLEDSDISHMLDLNIIPPISLTRLLLPLLREAPAAMVVNVGSTYGSIGYPGYSPYCASKFALRGFSEALRRELADTRVNVLYVAPRATQTRMNSAAAQALNDALKANTDNPEMVANAVIHAIAGDRRDLYLGWPERFFVSLNNLLPSLVDRALRKQLPLIRRFSHIGSTEKNKP